jgi:phospholipid transport system substrate-binding protein
MRRLFAGVFLALLLASGSVRADDTTAAKSYVDNVVKQATTIISQTQGGKLGGDKAKADFRVILNNSFDIPTISKFTLGSYWRVATPAQQQEFTGLIKTTILDKYADRLLESAGSKYSLDNATLLGNGDYSVPMTGYSKSGDAIAFGWRLRKFGGSFKVIDIAVEGVSMSVTHRSDFASVIERNGGKVDALLQAMRNHEFADNKAAGK